MQNLPHQPEGGVRLNLTAADYVSVLDSWWNPAVEVQALDWVHRIGQTRRVFACRFVAKDTAEEKVPNRRRPNAAWPAGSRTRTKA